MADIEIKAFDRRPSVEATLGYAGSSTVPNLTHVATTVHFILRSTAATATAPKVDAPAIIIDAPLARVRYDWAIGDTDTPGEYRAEWEVHYGDDTPSPETFPRSGYHTVAILADLNASA